MFSIDIEISDEVKCNTTPIKRADIYLFVSGKIVAHMVCYVNCGITPSIDAIHYFDQISNDCLHWYSRVRPKGRFIYISFIESLAKNEGYGSKLMDMSIKKFKEGLIVDGKKCIIGKIYGTIPKRDCIEKFYSLRKDLKSFYRGHGFKFKQDDFYRDITKDCYEPKINSRTIGQRRGIHHSVRPIYLPQTNYQSGRLGA